MAPAPAQPEISYAVRSSRFERPSARKRWLVSGAPRLTSVRTRNTPRSIHDARLAKRPASGSSIAADHRAAPESQLPETDLHFENH